jgi:hypothetical protein
LATAGTSARRADLLLPDRFPVVDSGRGGQFTFHGADGRLAERRAFMRHLGPLRRRKWFDVAEHLGGPAPARDSAGLDDATVLA